MKRLLQATLVAAMMVLVGVFAAGALAAPTPPFTQCPPVGLDTSCGTLIEVKANGELEAFNDPSQGPFDGVEDTLIGVQNNSNSAISSIALEGANIFGFEFDGICAGYSPGPPACPYGPTGYEGPGTAFTNTNANEGSVNFTGGGLAAGASTYFSLEGPVKLKCGPTGCKTVEACEAARGVGHLGTRGSEGLNEDNELNVSGKPHQFALTTPGTRISLLKLTSSSCTETAGGFEFKGQGPAKLNGAKGYEVTFAIETVGKEVFLTVTLENEAKEVVYSLNHEKLNKTSKEHFS